MLSRTALPLALALLFGFSLSAQEAAKTVAPAVLAEIELLKDDALQARAKEWVAQGKVLEAHAAYRRLLEKRPNLAAARREWAQMLSQVDDRAAAEQWTIISKADVTDPEAHHFLGLSLYRLGQSAPGIAELVEAVRLKPDYAGARKDLGAIFLRENRFMEASALYGETVRQHPDDADAHNDYGVVLIRLGDVDGALTQFNEAVRVNPKHIDAQYNLGLTQMQTWKLDEALAHLTAALELNPKYVDAIITFGRVLARMGRSEEATGAFLKVIEMVPTYADAHYELARQLLAGGKTKEAISRLSEAIRHNPNHGDAHRHLGLALLAEGKPQLALPQFRAALKDRKEDAQGHFELARALKLLDRRDEAIASYREALRLRPDWPEASNDLAWLLATAPEDKLRDGALARSIAERALEIARRREPMLLDTVAAAQAEAGKFEEAVATSRRSIELAKAIPDEKLVALLEEHYASFQRKKPVRVEPRK